MNFDTTEPRARKTYRCYLCDREIPKGEQHRKHVGSYDGDFYSVRAHLKCDKIAQGMTSDEYESTEPCEFRKLLS